MKSLKEFYQDVETRNNVYEYLVQFLSEQAIKKVFAKEDVSAVAEAKEMIDLAFENMDLIFQGKLKEKELKNEAR